MDNLRCFAVAEVGGATAVLLFMDAENVQNLEEVCCGAAPPRLQMEPDPRRAGINTAARLPVGNAFSAVAFKAGLRINTTPEPAIVS